MITHWTIFLLASLAIIIAGTKLAAYGEIIGYHTGIGQGWIGLIFLATITSIPELTTTITGALFKSQSIFSAPNVALELSTSDYSELEPDLSLCGGQNCSEVFLLKF